ncbi:MAG: ADOP family duplicated permease [Terriglobales bacterium]
MNPWQQAARTLARRPAYLATAVIVLALGIGATSALFSVVQTVLLAPLPYPNANRLALVLERNPARHEDLLAPARLAEWKRMNQSFTALAGRYTESETDTSGAEPVRLQGLRVSQDYFRLLAVPPVLGRWFTANEQAFHGPGAAIISSNLWMRRYHRNPAVLGRALVISGTRYTIVGVMPPTFGNPANNVWLPAQTPPGLLLAREARFYTGIGRLRPGVTFLQAQADLDRVETQLGRQYPATDAGWSAQVSSLKNAEVGSSSAALWTVFAAVLLLLLLAVANLAGLNLAQLHNRERELAVRSALGASRGQLLATVMREMLLLASAGALLGGLLAWAAVRAIASLTPGTLPRMNELHFSFWGWAFAVVISALAAAGFGLAPALAATRPSLSTRLAAAGHRIASGQRRAQHILVAGQLALTVLLLAGAGLLLRTYQNLSGVAGGFSTRNVLTFHVSAAWNEDRGQIASLQTNLLRLLRAQPGVVAAGFTNFLPASNATLQYAIQLQGLTGPSTDGAFSVGERSISPGYFEALQVPIVAGKACPTMQPLNQSATNVQALVNQSFEDTYLLGRNPVGMQFKMPSFGPSQTWSTIVGVVGNIRENSLATPATPFLYICIAAGGWPDPDYVVRTASGLGGLSGSIHRIVEAVAPGRAVFGLQPLRASIASSLEQPRLDSFGLSLFAAFALLLAAVGLYSLISLLVAGRKRELALRMALGATPASAALLVLASTGRLLLWGSLSGLALTWAASRLLASLLFGVTPTDASILAAAIALVALIALAATWLPACRAASTDPARALRE